MINRTRLDCYLSSNDIIEYFAKELDYLNREHTRLAHELGIQFDKSTWEEQVKIREQITKVDEALRAADIVRDYFGY